MFKKHILKLIFFGLMLISNTVFADSLTATVDRTNLSINETLTLTLKLEGSLNSDKTPDWQALNKDFTVLGTSTAQQLAIINGKTSKHTIWTLVLAPKHEGEISVPVFEIEKQKSNAIIVQVNSIKQSLEKGKTPALFLQTKIEPKQGYVQQQFIYTVSLYHNTAILSGGFTPPQIPNATIKQLDADSQYTAKINERSYQVIERRYLIFPQASGKIKLIPSMFGGTVAEPVSRDDLLDSSFIGTNAKPVQIKANSIELDIKAKPANFTGVWLPAKKISLVHSWAVNPPLFRVGEPVTLNLSMRAEGLLAEQLPDLKITTVNNLNIYPDKPSLINNTENNNVVGMREQKIALIPTKAGKLEIPAMSLNWWNIETNRAETINIPAQIVNVLPGITNTPTNISPVSNATSSVQPTSNAIKSVTSEIKKPFNYWPWIIAGLFFIAWISTLLLWFISKHRKSNSNISDIQKPDSLRQTIKQLAHACETNDPKEIQTALLAWARTCWPHSTIRSLNDVVDHVYSTELKDAIKELDRLLYSDKTKTWDGKNLWQLFEADSLGIEPKSKVKNEDTLPPLYPK